ncbi:hypothetical protein K445DRAFT_29946, partial [Daldinia sp. EC12]
CSCALPDSATSQYVSAQKYGEANPLTRLIEELIYTEDERQLEKIIGRMLSQPITPDRSLNIHNKASYATFAELIAATAPKHYVIGTEILFTGNELAAIESIVMVKGDW